MEPQAKYLRTKLEMRVDWDPECEWSVTVTRPGMPGVEAETWSSGESPTLKDALARVAQMMDEYPGGEPTYSFEIDDNRPDLRLV